jgi:CrcB protein
LLEKYLLVMLGGATGSLARYVAGDAIMNRLGRRFPLGTLAIGLLMALFTQRFQPHPNWRLLLVVGFLGGYTTFSTFEYETYSAIRDGGPWIGLINIVASVALGYLAVWFGVLLATRR